MQAIRDVMRTDISVKTVDEMAVEFMIWFGSRVA
jgi:hypothetical protein